MLKAIEQLLRGERNKVGNHRVMTDDDGVRCFYYHSTVICYADDRNATFHTDDGGWGTSSTHRAMNDYSKYFTALGYTDTSNSDWVK